MCHPWVDAELSQSVVALADAVYLVRIANQAFSAFRSMLSTKNGAHLATIAFSPVHRALLLT
jgi:hypothetical protein